MRFQASTASALVAALLVKDVVAAVHGRHYQYHQRRAPLDVTVTDEVVQTTTETIYVTIDWPSGKTLGVDEYGSVAAHAAAPAASPTSSAEDDEWECDDITSSVPAVADVTTSVEVTVIPTPASSPEATPEPGAPTTSAAPAATEAPAAPTTPVEAVPFTPDPTPASSSTPANGGVFVENPNTTKEPASPAPVPTTMATVVRPTTTAAVEVPASTPPTSPPATGGDAPVSNKRGLAYNDASLTNAFIGGNSRLSWAYNWGSSTSGLNPAFEYIPTLWGNHADKTGPWAANAAAAIASGSKHLFSFNEPDIGSQANIDYKTAAADHKKYMEPFAGKGVAIGAPAVTNGGGDMGLTYLKNFLGECKDCPIDFINIHWYDSATNFGYFKNHVKDAYKAGGNRPVWITEFAASGSEEEQNKFLEVVLPWLDEQDFVHRYAYFMASDGVLLKGKSLSPLGTTFMTFTSTTISPLIAKS